MNKHRVLPLAFVLTFSLCAPILAAAGTPGKKSPAEMAITRSLARAGNGALTAWEQWHEKNEGFAELVSLNQK